MWKPRRRLQFLKTKRALVRKITYFSVVNVFLIIEHVNGAERSELRPLLQFSPGETSSQKAFYGNQAQMD